MDDKIEKFILGIFLHMACRERGFETGIGDMASEEWFRYTQMANKLSASIGFKEDREKAKHGS